VVIYVILLLGDLLKDIASLRQDATTDISIMKNACEICGVSEIIDMLSLRNESGIMDNPSILTNGKRLNMTVYLFILIYAKT
jgi:hypothetical protein